MNGENEFVVPKSHSNPDKFVHVSLSFLHNKFKNNFTKIYLVKVV